MSSKRSHDDAGAAIATTINARVNRMILNDATWLHDWNMDRYGPARSSGRLEDAQKIVR